MKKNTLRTVLSCAASASLALALLSGCGSTGAADAAAESKPAADESGSIGTVLLSVNPEIEVEYDDSGLVVEVEGINDDGRSIAAAYTGYENKDCQTVVGELVQEIYDAGYFSETIDGHTKNIVLKLEEGSAYPDDDFLEGVAQSVRDTVQACGIGSKAVTVDEDDLDDAGYINQSKAEELVLTQLELPAAEFTVHEYDLDDGVYEVEFTANGVEYEYEVDARTGKVLEADLEGNDDWDDRDSWDDDGLDDDLDGDDDTDDLDDDLDDGADDDDIDDLDDDSDDDDIDDLNDDQDDDSDDDSDDLDDVWDDDSDDDDSDDQDDDWGDDSDDDDSDDQDDDWNDDSDDDDSDDLDDSWGDDSDDDDNDDLDDDWDDDSDDD